MVITWFDILLVTLLAAVTALGVRRGLSGLGLGLGGLLIAWLANVLGLAAPLALLLGLALSFGLSVGLSQWLPRPLEQPWHLLAGGIGGFLLGGLLVASLALAFPLSTQKTRTGQQAYYPAPALAKWSPNLYTAVANSAIQQHLSGVWSAAPALRTLVVPDWK